MKPSGFLHLHRQVERLFARWGYPDKLTQAQQRRIDKKLAKLERFRICIEERLARKALAYAV